MKSLLALLLGVHLFVMPGLAQAQNLSADDFLPPAQAKSATEEAALRQVKDRASVKTVVGAITGKQVITAASDQDAINAYLEQGTDEFDEVQLSTGAFAFVATGVATYRKYDNLIATRIAQLNAYNRAYINAKKNFSVGYYGLPNESKNQVAEILSTIDEATPNTLKRVETSTSDSIYQTGEGLLRGHVVYDVSDQVDDAQGTVKVTIVTTPKTQGHFERPDPSSLAASSVREGLDQILAEIKKGLVPPIGGRTVFVPATGEMALIGFGASVVRFDEDKALQAKLNLNAEKIAKMRAGAGLVSIFEDKVSYGDNLDNPTKELLADFETAEKDDPLAKPAADSSNYKMLNKRKMESLTLQTTSEFVSSLQKGLIPPGVKFRVWRDPDNAFAHSVAVYLPSASARAIQARETMLQGQVVQNPGEKNNTTPITGEFKPGPSGRVQRDEDL